jgi:ABC-type nickel/cobalt efflux system permease component RcnA
MARRPALRLGTQYSVLRTRYSAPVTLALLCLALLPAAAGAHPVAERTYDRTIAVRLAADAVAVEYELEVNTATVERDLAELGDDIDLSKCRQPRDFYEAFARFHAPVLARNLDARLDGRPLTFDCAGRDFEVREKVSLHCRFLFRAPWRPAPDLRHVFTFKEGNYEQRAGRVRLSLAHTERVAIGQASAPTAALQNKALTLLAQGEEDRLREASVSFTLTAEKEPRGLLRLGAPQGDAGQAELKPAESDGAGATAAALKGDEGIEDRAAAKGVPEAPAPSPWDARGLDDLLLHRGEALGLLLVVAAFLGAAHALTPGHGKTLVAAYLVGERGTVGHALYLGLVTTLSHTGVVLGVALAVQLVWGGRAPPSLQSWLGLGGGLLVAGMGAWLLLARLTGRADHVHLVGGHHHHHHGHGHADHYHDDHGHAHPLPGERVGWWRLTVLGVTGGIIPCHDAVALYLALLSAGLLAFALPLLLAFSAGLAAVLVAIGVVVVKAKGLAGRRWGESRAFRALPIVSAALVTSVGLWLCYHSLPTMPGH